MQYSSVEQQLRGFLLGVSGFILLGTIVELMLIEHTGDIVQWIPFILCGLGLLSLLWFWISPSKRTLYTVRGVMVMLALGSVFGVYEHFVTNYAFSMEIHPAYTALENMGVAIKGASPMLAPGILFLAALLAAVMTYKHPILKKENGNQEGGVIK